MNTDKRNPVGRWLDRQKGSEMTKAKFIEEIKEMANRLEQDNYYFIDLKSGYMFGNKNYGEIHCTVADGVSLSVMLYTSDDEKEGDAE